MAVKVVRRRELTFWEKLYIPQILCGLKQRITDFVNGLRDHDFRFDRGFAGPPPGGPPPGYRAA